MGKIIKRKIRDGVLRVCRWKIRQRDCAFNIFWIDSTAVKIPLFQLLKIKDVTIEARDVVFDPTCLKINVPEYSEQSQEFQSASEDTKLETQSFELRRKKRNVKKEKRHPCRKSLMFMHGAAKRAEPKNNASVTNYALELREKARREGKQRQGIDALAVKYLFSRWFVEFQPPFPATAGPCKSR